ncbi:FKBP-type peptidyl-prolyl cis-trans isomerase [candidate division KSB1 bacterium]
MKKAIWALCMTVVFFSCSGVVSKGGDAASQGSLAEARSFLEENAMKTGVLSISDKLQYKIIKEGIGTSPGINDRIRVNYYGFFIDGRVFDSTVESGPRVFTVSSMIDGWIEALMQMKEGAVWELYIHPDLAYGSRGRGPVPANTLLIFELELIEILK